jgi:hypothetical protein
MAEEFGWTPQQVARMTLPQLELILAGEKRRKMGFAEARALGLR